MYFYIFVFLHVLVFNIKSHSNSHCVSLLNWLIVMVYIFERIPIDNADMSNEKVNLALSLWYLN